MSLPRSKFYFLAPTTESPINGPIFLGGIITHPRNADRPLNISPLSIIDPITVYTDELNDYSVEFEKSRSGSLGIWLSFLMQILGIGGDIEAKLGRKVAEEWKIKKLKTMWFNPTPEYIKNSLEHSAVAQFLKEDKSWLRSSKLYMITGVKLAYGASGAITAAKDKGINLHLGIDATSLGVPVQGGPNIGGNMENKTHQSFGEKTPFVLAFRMQRINVSSSGLATDRPITGGMLGLGNEQGESASTNDVFAGYTVQGVEGVDTGANEFGIGKEWEISDHVGATIQTCGCASVRDL